MRLVIGGLLLGVLAISSCVIWVWPTLYQYDHLDVGAGQSLPVRINRFSGRAEVLSLDGWKSTYKDPKESLAEQNMSVEECSKLDAQAKLSELHLLRLSLYNGSSLNLKEIMVEVSVRDSDLHEISRRIYKINAAPDGIRPQYAGYFETYLGVDVGATETWKWRIVGAKGSLSMGAFHGTPAVVYSEKINFILNDPEFWEMPNADQRGVIQTLDWDFAKLSLAAQNLFLKNAYDRFVNSGPHQRLPPHFTPPWRDTPEQEEKEFRKTLGQ